MRLLEVSGPRGSISMDIDKFPEKLKKKLVNALEEAWDYQMDVAEKRARKRRRDEYLRLKEEFEDRKKYRRIK